MRAAAYTSLLDQYLGSAAANVELLTTEFNSVYSNPGKQSTSLVNGLFIADSIGALLETPYDGAIVWALRNGPYDTSNNDSSSLYGWREGGDYGLLGTSPDDPPATGAYIPYPSYFGEQLASNIIQAGGSVVQASSNDPDLAVYAVHEANGDVDLLVINKSPSGPITGQFAVAGFQPDAQAKVLQYGEAQDTAQSESSTGQSALATFTTALSLSGSDFSLAFPAYSMSVLELSPPATATGPSITQPAASSPNPVTRTSTVLSVSSFRPGRGGLADLHLVHGRLLAYGRCVQRQRHERRRRHDSHFQPGGHLRIPGCRNRHQRLERTPSDVVVNVDQTLTSIKVSPPAATVAASSARPFTAQADDQFGNSMSPQPSFAWSLATGIGSVNPATGVYSAPGAAGSAVVEASSGGVQGTAGVTVAVPSGPSATVRYADSNDWKSGFVGDVMITNSGPSAIGPWTLQFDLKEKIKSIWGATIVSHKGNQYTVESLTYDALIPPGESVSFGFQGKPGRAEPGPSNWVLDGVSLTVAPLAPPPSATVTFMETAQSKARILRVDHDHQHGLGSDRRLGFAVQLLTQDLLAEQRGDRSAHGRGLRDPGPRLRRCDRSWQERELPVQRVAAQAQVRAVKVLA